VTSAASAVHDAAPCASSLPSRLLHRFAGRRGLPRVIHATVRDEIHWPWLWCCVACNCGRLLVGGGRGIRADVPTVLDDGERDAACARAAAD
jgi:hypothetical protein